MKETETALKATYERAVLLINELTEEVQALEIKYGTESKLVNKKKEQIETIRTLYKNSAAYIDFMRDLNFKLTINYQALEIVTLHHETGLPYEKIARMMDYNQADFKKLDDIDPLFRKMMAEFIEREKLTQGGK